MSHSQLRSEYRSARQIAALLAVITTIILIRNLALDSPLLSGDEYAYFAAAQTFPHSAARFARDPYLPRIYSPVFAAYGRALGSLSDHPELMMKALNTICFALTALLFLCLIRKVGRVATSPMPAAVFLLLPTSAQTAYFMPETTYAFLFALLTWSVVALLPAHVFAGAMLSGIVVGTMLLVKPHALALFLTVLLTIGALLAAPSAFRPDRRALLAGLALFVISTYVTLVVLNGVLTRQLLLSPLAFVGSIYRPYLNQGASVTSWVGRSRELLAVLAGHLVVFGALLAPAIALGAARLRRLYASEPLPANAELSRDRRRFALICFAIIATLLTLGMTTNFTVQAAQMLPAEHFRLHGRYYSFVIPLFLVLFFGLAEADNSDPAADAWIRTGAIGGCVMAALLYYLQEKRIIYPFDYPEAFVFSSWHGHERAGLAAVAVEVLTYAGIVAAVISYGLIVWRGRPALYLYPLLLLALFAVSNIGVTAWQHASSVDNAALCADARAMRQLISPSEIDQGLVVGPEWNGPLAYFLFNLGSSARVLVRPPGSVLTDTDVPAEARWMLLIGKYQTAFRSTVSVRTTQVALIRLGASDSGAGPARDRFPRIAGVVTRNPR